MEYSLLTIFLEWLTNNGLDRTKENIIDICSDRNIQNSLLEYVNKHILFYHEHNIDVTELKRYLKDEFPTDAQKYLKATFNNQEKIEEEILSRIYNYVHATTKEDKNIIVKFLKDTIDIYISNTNDELIKLFIHNNQSFQELLQEITFAINTSTNIVSKKNLDKNSIQYYFINLQYYHSSNPVLFTPCDNYKTSENIFIEIDKQLSGNTWKQNILNHIVYSENNYHMPSDIDLNQVKNLLNQRIDYNIVFTFLSTYIRSCKKSDFINKLNKLINSSYNKVFIVSGEFGSGKTHFLKGFIQYSLEANQEHYFIIPLRNVDIIPLNSKGRIKEYLLASFNRYLGTSFSTFDDFFDNNNNKIIYVIDDIHTIFIYNKHMISLMLEVIDELTKYDYIYWMLSISEYELYNLENNKNFLQKYCITLLETTTTFRNTFNLTNYNNMQNIGIKILSNYGKKMHSSIISLNHIQNNIYKPYNTPLYAHMLGTYVADSEIILPNPSVYLDFTISLCELINSRIKNDHGFEDSNSIFNDINKIAMNSVDSGSIKFYNDVNLNLHCLPLLQNVGLLQKIQEKPDIFALNPLADQYELYIKNYWILRITLLIYSVYMNNKSIDILFTKCNKIECYKDDLFIYTLLYLDHKNCVFEYTKFFEILINKKLLHYALFAGIKATLVYCDNLFNLLINNQRISLTKVETYALLIFLYHFNISFEDKCTLLAKYGNVIYSNDLCSYFISIFRLTISHLTSLKNFKKSIIPLFFISDQHVLKNSLSSLLSQKYFEMESTTDKDLHTRINDLIDYIINIRSFRTNQDFYSSSCLIDYFITGYFEQIITSDKHGLKQLYNILRCNM